MTTQTTAQKFYSPAMHGMLMQVLREREAARKAMSDFVSQGSFCGLGYRVRRGESHCDGATRAVKRAYGKAAFLSKSHSPCENGPWRVEVLTPAKGGGYDVHAGSWQHAEFFAPVSR